MVFVVFFYFWWLFSPAPDFDEEVFGFEREAMVAISQSLSFSPFKVSVRRGADSVLSLPSPSRVRYRVASRRQLNSDAASAPASHFHFHRFLSEEEQNALAAIPAHPEGLYALYACCLAGNLVEQLWSFAWPLAIALLHPSLIPVAVMGFFTKVAIVPLR